MLGVPFVIYGYCSSDHSDRFKSPSLLPERKRMSPLQKL